jgi:hypothetical protein
MGWGCGFCEAEALFREALQTFARESEEETPQIARVLSELSWRVEEQGRLPEAERLKEKAIESFEHTLPPDSERLPEEREEVADLRQKIWDSRG